MPERGKKIIILGGGFGGMYTAMHLCKKLPRQDGHRITVVSRDNFLLFTPMLHEVASSDLELTNIVTPIRKMAPHAQFFTADVEKIDLASKTVVVAHGFDRHTHELSYDYLVIAMGSVTNFYNLPGLAERAVQMKSLGDAIHLRNRLISLLEEADAECAAASREPLMTIVVAGGGFAGVETVGGVNDFLRESLRHYPNIDPKFIRLVLVSSTPIILPELGEELGRYAQKKLAMRGVEILTQTKVASVTDEGVTLSGGQFIKTNTIVWTAGTSPHPLLGSLGCKLEHGRIPVNEFLELPGYPGVWALGDCAVVPDKHTGKPHPPTAQHALREGKTCAHNIAAEITGGSKKEFDFKMLGQLAAIGRRAGVAKVFGFKFSGMPAWFLWRTIYLSKLPRLDRKVRVALDWTLDLFFGKDLVQYQTFRSHAMSGDLADGGRMIPPARTDCPHPAMELTKKEHA